MGCVDIAGSGGVHLVGGVSALVATMILQPRLGRFKSDDGEVITDKHNDLPMGNATNALVGMFMLWYILVLYRFMMLHCSFELH